MKPKASITVFMSLVLMLALSLILTSYTAVRAAAGRSELANAADQALFSLFAHYDRDLLEKYDVFFIDGSFGGSGLHLEEACRFTEDAMAYVTGPAKGRLTTAKDLIPLTVTATSVTGYALATDLAGGVFAAQAVESMKETAVLQGIHLLSDHISIIGGSSEAARDEGQAVEEALSGGGLDEIRARAEAARQEAESASGEASGSGSHDGGSGETAVTVPADFQNPLDTVATLKKTSLLRLVHPSPEGISGRTVANGSLMSARNCQSGMGILDAREAAVSGADELWLNEYIVRHFGSAVHPESGSGLVYPAEQILKGKNSDLANLEAIARELLLIREGVNLVHIYRDPSLKEQARAAAMVIAAAILMPEAEILIEPLVIAGWAFAESLLDLRTLFGGGFIPLVKNTSDWQVPLLQIPAMAADMDAFRKPAASGLDYTDHLRALLAMLSHTGKVSRMCDMVEHEVRSAGRPAFCLDSCLMSLDLEIEARTDGPLTLRAERSMSYRDFRT